MQTQRADANASALFSCGRVFVVYPKPSEMSQGAVLILLFVSAKSNQKRTFLRSFCFCKKNQKAAARTRQKLPVASFGVSETAETGSIVSGCEQDDHVSRRLWVATLPTPGLRFKIPSGGLLAKPQAMCLSRNFYENLQPCAIQLGVF